MGSIAPEGTADVFCYAHGDEIIDPNLGVHLSNFGINLLSQQKTEKSIAELQLEQNLKFDFSMTTEDGKQLDPLFGPGFTGLKNLGNSCYMASILQSVFAVQSVADHYRNNFVAHAERCVDPPADCFRCQMGKLADGLLSGKYSTPSSSDASDQNANEQLRAQDGIAPAMFKAVIGKGHGEFSTMRQQDAQEFLQHLLTTIEQKERSSGNDPSSWFHFKLEQRMQCLECERVGYTAFDSSGIILPVPARLIGEIDGKKEYESVALERCLDDYFAQDIRQLQCPHDKHATSASFIQHFRTFPQVLTLTMARFVLGEGWVMEKLNANIHVPLTIDLDKYRSAGKSANEVLLPKDVSTASGSAPEIDPTTLEQLLAMGFAENTCKRAIVKTGNAGAEVAMAWLFEHLNDADIDAPLESSGGPSVSESEIAQLADMGFTSAQAKRALRETGGNMERAVDWLFSHAEEPVDESDASAAQNQPEIDSASAVYELFAFVAHRGTSAHCGHYVAYVCRGDVWALFNDNKVARVPDISPHLGEGYIYFFKRK